MTRIRQEGVATFCILPLTTARRRVGVLAFARLEHVTYTAADVAFLYEVAKLVAVAIENALNFDDAQAAQRQLAAERDISGCCSTLIRAVKPTLRPMLPRHR